MSPEPEEMEEEEEQKSSYGSEDDENKNHGLKVTVDDMKSDIAEMKQMFNAILTS